MYSCRPLHMDKQRLGDQLEPIYNSYVLTQDATWKTSREQWTIEMGSENEDQGDPWSKHDMMMWTYVNVTNDVLNNIV